MAKCSEERSLVVGCPSALLQGVYAWRLHPSSWQPEVTSSQVCFSPSTILLFFFCSGGPFLFLANATAGAPGTYLLWLTQIGDSGGIPGLLLGLPYGKKLSSWSLAATHLACSGVNSRSEDYIHSRRSQRRGWNIKDSRGERKERHS